MEVQLFNNGVSEEYTTEVVTHFDNLGSEGERCGICMDVVIDRGVLDCCQHWFCFVCIDNWATITNLCPLCQKEFQLITCIPVFDTVGSGKDDEDLDSRDDDRCVEEKNNILSFPPYYIDENAVRCLDEVGCKIRSGLVPYEETLTLDTSIACDSCDIWYHAFCVEFDPEGTVVDSWLCPRCRAIEAEKKSVLSEMHSTETHNGPQVDKSSSKVSLCVADTRETALVVSRVNREDVVREPIVICCSSKRFSDNHHGFEQSIVGIQCSSEMKMSSDQGMNNIQLEPMVPLTKLGDIVIKSEPVDSDPRMSLDMGKSFASDLSDGKPNNSSSHNWFLHHASSRENAEDLKVDIGHRLGEKRKFRGAEF